MTILFEQERDSTFAISKNELYQHKQCDELLWAEIQRKGDVYYVAWEGEYPKKTAFSTLEQAKSHILRECTNHRPYINGASFDLDGE